METGSDWAKSSGGPRGVGDDFVGCWVADRRARVSVARELCAEFHIGMFFWRKGLWFSSDSQEASNSEEHRKV